MRILFSAGFVCFKTNLQLLPDGGICFLRGEWCGKRDIVDTFRVALKDMISQLELMIFSGYLWSTAKVVQDHLHPICCGPVLLGPMSSCLPMQQVGKCISASAAENKDYKEVLSFLQSQLMQLLDLVQGQGRSAWWEQAGHQATIELHPLLTVSHLTESGQGRRRRSWSSFSLVLQPHAPAPFPLGWG